MNSVGEAAARPGARRDRPQGRDGRHRGPVHRAACRRTLKPDLLRAVLNENAAPKRVIVFARTTQPRRLHLPPPQARGLRAPRPSTPTAARTSAAARSTTSPRARPTSSWPPTCWPAASTWTRWTTWSTTTCPPSRRTTCTASAAPAAPAQRGYAISFVTPRNGRCPAATSRSSSSGRYPRWRSRARRGRGRVGSGRPRHARQCTQGPRAGPGRTRAGPQGAQKGTGEGSRPRRERGREERPPEAAGHLRAGRRRGRPARAGRCRTASGPPSSQGASRPQPAGASPARQAALRGRREPPRRQGLPHAGRRRHPAARSPRERVRGGPSRARRT